MTTNQPLTTNQQISSLTNQQISPFVPSVSSTVANFNPNPQQTIQQIYVDPMTVDEALRIREQSDLPMTMGGPSAMQRRRATRVLKKAGIIKTDTDFDQYQIEKNDNIMNG